MEDRRKLSGGVLDAYYTIEAAFLIPMLLAVTFFLFYMGIFQYNRCIAEQGVKHILVLASNNEAEDAEISTRVSKLYEFPFLSCRKLEIRRDGKSIDAFFTGGIHNFLSDVGINTKADYFQINLNHSIKMFQPVSFIRDIRKVEKYVKNGFCE